MKVMGLSITYVLEIYSKESKNYVLSGIWFWILLPMPKKKRKRKKKSKNRQNKNDRKLVPLEARK